MKVLLPTVGSAGDVYPMIGLGRTLQQRGHRVTVLANPIHAETVRGAGLPFHPLGTRAQADAVLSDPRLWHPRYGFATIGYGAVLPAMRPLYEFIAGQDTSDLVVAAQSMALGARLAQEKLGVPLATLHLQPALLRSLHEMPVSGIALPAWLPRPLKRAWWLLVDRLVIDPVLGAGVNTLRAELGLPPVSRLFAGWFHSPQRILGLFPDWFAPPQPDWPPQLRLTGFPLFDVGAGTPLPDGLQRFLAGGDPPFVFTFGTAMQHGQELFKMAVAVTQRLGRRAILLARERSQLPDAWPESIHYEPYVPLGDLLPYAALLAHHGGIGTVAQGLAAGVPQLVFPMSHDQPDNASRLERLGAGLGLSPWRLRPAAVAGAIDRLLSAGKVKARCHTLAQRLDAQRARDAAATWIEQLAARPQGIN